MAAHLGVRTHELLYEEIGNNIAEMFSAWEKAKCYEEVTNHSKRIFTLVQNNNFWCFHKFMKYPIVESNFFCSNQIKNTLGIVGFLDGKIVFLYISDLLLEFSYRPIVCAHSVMSNHLV